MNVKAKNARCRLFDVSSGEQIALREGPHREALEGAAGDPLVVLVPADRCSVVAVDLPEMNAERMSRALRWAAEDAIAGDPEQQHVVPVRRRADGRLQCVVAATADMQQWISAAPDRPNRMVPDAACLPWNDGEIVLAASGDSLLARFGPLDFDRFDPELAESLLPELIESAGKGARLIWLGERPPSTLESFRPEIRPVPGGIMKVLARGATGSPVDLMSGEYSARNRVGGWRRWRRAAMLAGLAVVGLLGVEMIEQAVLESQLARAEDNVQQRFERLFPEITTIVRPRAQAERALAGLRGQSRDRFVHMMRRVSPLFGGAASIRVESLNYSGARIELTLRTPGLDDIEALQRQLQAQGLEATVRDVAVEADATRSRLLIGEAL